MNGCKQAIFAENYEHRERERGRGSERAREVEKQAVREAGRQTDERVREVHHTRARTHAHTHEHLNMQAVLILSTLKALSGYYFLSTTFLHIYRHNTHMHTHTSCICNTNSVSIHTVSFKVNYFLRRSHRTNTYKLKCHMRHIPPIDSFLDVPCRQHFSVHSTHWKHLPFRRATFFAAVAYTACSLARIFFFTPNYSRINGAHREQAHRARPGALHDTSACNQVSELYLVAMPEDTVVSMFFVFMFACVRCLCSVGL
jgi:hypothetical protein